MAAVLRSPIALATVVALALSACSGVGDTFLEDGEPELTGVMGVAHHTEAKNSEAIRANSFDIPASWPWPARP